MTDADLNERFDSIIILMSEIVDELRAIRMFAEMDAKEKRGEADTGHTVITHPGCNSGPSIPTNPIDIGQFRPKDILNDR